MAITDVGGGAGTGAVGRDLLEVDVVGSPPGGVGAAATARVGQGARVEGESVQALSGGAPAYQAMPTRSGYTPIASAFSGAERGYAATAARSSGSKTAAKSASKTSTAKTSAARKSTAAKTSTAKKTSASGPSAAELAFLDDPNLSIEDKLFRFMALMQQRSDRELTDAMKQYEEKKAAAKTTSSAASSSTGTTSSGGTTTEKSSGGGGGGGLFGALGDALGGIAKTVVSGAESLAKDLGGPLLAAGCTAVGLPFLAPVALQIGGPLAKSAVSGVATAVGLDERGSAASSANGSARPSTATSIAARTSSTSKASSSTSASADEGELDEKLEMMKLQRLVEKQETMFAALSNVLKAQHDGQMVAVNNIR
jgi:hypothetical protein